MGWLYYRISTLRRDFDHQGSSSTQTLGSSGGSRIAPTIRYRSSRLCIYEGVPDARRDYTRCWDCRLNQR